jgi:putative flippase GtrA
METQHAEFLKFVAVGVLSNLVLYAIYLALTYLDVGHKLAMSLLYVIGVIQTFIFNKRWSFRHRGGSPIPFLRYVTIYALSYVFNLAVLVILVDRMGFPHQIVQGAMIVAVAILTFVLQKYWVFRSIVP